MDALVIHAAEDLRVEDVPTPDVGPRQLRVKVRYGGICGSDLSACGHGLNQDLARAWFGVGHGVDTKFTVA